MSMESAKLFIKKMETDEDFNKKINECKDQKTRMAFIKAEGFDFTPEEINEAKNLLSDEEISKISGGEGDSPYCPTVVFGM